MLLLPLLLRTEGLEGLSTLIFSEYL